MADTDDPASAESSLNLESWLLFMKQLAKDPKTSPHIESVAAALMSVVGAQPAAATAQSLIAASQANALMFHNAVANQQQSNILGMVATMNCIQSLLDKPGQIPFPNFPQPPSFEDESEPRE